MLPSLTDIQKMRQMNRTERKATAFNLANAKDQAFLSLPTWGQERVRQQHVEAAA